MSVTAEYGMIQQAGFRPERTETDPAHGGAGIFKG
jgi:hypothetical protein